MTVKASENEILSLLTRTAQEKRVSLTYAHKVFFLRLVSYAEVYGVEGQEGLLVSVSVPELSDELRIPLRTTIQSLNRLVACGVLFRSRGKNSFPRSPYDTLLYRKFYEKRD